MDGDANEGTNEGTYSKGAPYLNLVKHPFHVITRGGAMVGAFASMKTAVSSVVLNARVNCKIVDMIENKTYNYMDVLRIRGRYGI
jgi:hypothetical protein